MDSRRKLTILQLNDIHGYLEPHREFVWSDGEPSFPIMGGFARIATLFARIRQEVNGATLALDNGDMFHGTYVAVKSKGVDLIPAVNALMLDAITAHWEFAWGPKHFEDLVSKLDHPMLALNCYRKDSGTRPFPSSTVIERAGLKVGIIGMAATIIDKSMPPHFSDGLRFDIDEAAVANEIARLRGDRDCDLIILLSHLGLPQDIKLAGNVPGIDIILSGHTHNRLTEPIIVDGTLIIQSGCHGSYIGRLDVEISADKVTHWTHSLIPVDETISESLPMKAIVDKIMAPHRVMLEEVVGFCKMALHRCTQMDAPMDDVLLAAIATAAGTDVAFSNGWRYGAPVATGAVTVNDLWNIIPTNPPVSTVIVTVREIRQMIEENLERTFSANPYMQMGGYLKRFRGLTLIGKLENPIGTRIEHMFAADGKLEDDRELKVAFVTDQGVPEQYGRDRQNLTMSAIDALRRYFSNETVGLIGNVGRFIPE